MLKILSTEQIRALDAVTIQRENISSIDLMERACQAFVRWYTVRFDIEKKIGIICGTGNNGGDGLGIARILTDWGYVVKVWVIKGPGKASGDFEINLDRVNGRIDIREFTGSTSAFPDCEVLIDAIFGSGLSRPAEGIQERAIQVINSQPATRIAIDIPSGLFADKHSTGTIVNAHHTVAFQIPKLAFLFPENYSYVGEWHLADIGLDKPSIKESTSTSFYLTKKSVKKILKSKSTFDHKGDNGKALLIAGSYGKMGACVLSARACIRAGVGLLTAHIPKLGYTVLQSTVPEAMVSVDNNDEFFSIAPGADPFDVIGIGPGIGQGPLTVKAFEEILASGKPMIIDADGLNILGNHTALFHSIPAGSILTPHPKEFERLVGAWKDDFDRLEKQRRFSRETKAVIILKGGPHVHSNTRRKGVFQLYRKSRNGEGRSR
ncbi:MAG: NAD(P)H-hydrate dehydratase [Bacteroidota bacterium]